MSQDPADLDLPPGLRRMRLTAYYSTLVSFSSWEPAMLLCGAIEDYFSTGAGITEREYGRAKKWTLRIGALDERLVKFYCEHAAVDKTASVALWRILDGGGPLEGWQYRNLRRLWEDSHGFPPAIELCPRMR
jgi:hypothetical protein|tara:strand:- start:11868 stop:12263 length:396 start_codon:yes stop_codon:yes gene_type:complete